MAEERTIRYRVTAATQGFQAGMTRAATSAQHSTSRIGASMQRNRQALTAAGTAAVGFGVAVGIGLGRAVSAGAEFEAEMNQVRAVSGATGAEFEQLSGIAREMGASTKFGASEAAEGLSFLSMAGFEAQESVEALPGVLDLAAAGGMELGRSADLASNVLQGFSMEADEMSTVVDTMAATFTSSNTSLEQMGQAMGFVAPVANAAGLELEETAAAIGLMGDAGIQGTRAGTALRQSLSSLLSPTGSAEEAIDRLGLEVTNTHDELLPLHDIIGQLEERGATAADIMDLFGQRAGPGMQALLDRGSDAIQDFTGDLEDSGGAAKDVAETQLEGLRGSMTELGSAFEGLQIKIAESGLLGSLESVADTTTGAVRALEGLPDPAVRVGTTALSAAGGVSTLGGVVAIAGPRIADMTRSLGGMRRVLSRGLGIAGVITLLSELNHSFQEGRASAEAMIDEIVEGSDSATEAIEGIDQSLDDHIDEVTSAENVWSGFGKSLTGIGAFLQAKESINDIGKALELWTGKSEAAAEAAKDSAVVLALQAGEVNNLTGAILDLDDATAQVGPTRDRAAALEAEGDAAEGAAAKLEGVSGSLDRLSGTQQNATEALSTGFDTFDEYRRRTRELAEGTDRAVDDIDDSWQRFQESQQQTLEDQGAWMDNLQTLRERGFAELADDLAARGPEQAGLVAEAAESSNEALREGEDRALAIREQKAEAALAQIQSSGENMVAAAGGVSDETVEEIADKLGVLPEDVREMLVDTDTVVEGQMEAIEERFGKGAARAVQAMADELEAGTEEIAAIISRYADGIMRLDGATVVVDPGVSVTTSHGTATLRHSGGPVGGGGPTRRLHTGGAATQAAPDAGLAANERLAVLQTSEHVLTGEQMSVLQGMLGGQRGQAAQPTEQRVDRSVQVGQVVAHDYDDFMSQMSQRRRVAALQGNR